MFQVKGPRAFADMRRDVECKVANHAFAEEGATEMRVAVSCMKVVEGCAAIMRIVREGDTVTEPDNLQ
jgi:hypothetical protein